MRDDFKEVERVALLMFVVCSRSVADFCSSVYWIGVVDTARAIPVCNIFGCFGQVASP